MVEEWDGGDYIRPKGSPHWLALCGRSSGCGQWKMIHVEPKAPHRVKLEVAAAAAAAQREEEGKPGIPTAGKSAGGAVGAGAAVGGDPKTETKAEARAEERLAERRRKREALEASRAAARNRQAR